MHVYIFHGAFLEGGRFGLADLLSRKGFRGPVTKRRGILKANVMPTGLELDSCHKHTKTKARVINTL